MNTAQKDVATKPLVLQLKPCPVCKHAEFHDEQGTKEQFCRDENCYCTFEFQSNAIAAVMTAVANRRPRTPDSLTCNKWHNPHVFVEGICIGDFWIKERA